MQPGISYHLYTHANGSENLFRNDENFRYFLKRYREFASGIADALAYCLMPNHLHLLVRIKSKEELITYFERKYPDLNLQESTTVLEKFTILQFSHLLNAYTKAYNKMYKRRGSLFTRSFRRKEIVDDTYFSQVILYIHNKPVHHGFVHNIRDWKWSSYLGILEGTSSLVNYEEIIDWFGNRDQFVAAHR